MTAPSGVHEITVTVNGAVVRVRVEARRMLSDFIRADLRLVGTHVGCEQGSCGACTVLLDGRPVRSCLTLAVQADGCDIRTVESLAPDGETLHPVQEAFREEHGMQCGYCTPGFLMTLAALSERDKVSDDELVDELSGHLCRCTGYRNILAAARAALGDRLES